MSVQYEKIHGPRLQNRPSLGIFDYFGILTFWVSLITQLVIGFVLIANRNVQYPTFDDNSVPTCPTSGYVLSTTCVRTGVSITELCVTNGFCEDIATTCANNTPVFGRLLATSTSPAESIWQLYARYPEIPAVIFSLLIVLCAIWMYVINKFTSYVVWGTIVLDIVLLIGIYFYWLGQFETNNWMLLVIAGLIGVMSIWFRKSIQKAIRIMKVATDAIHSNPSIVFACLVIEIIYVVYLILWSLFVIYGSNYYEVTTTGGIHCSLSQTSFSSSSLTFFAIMFWIFTYFFINAMLVVCSVAVGHWFFGNQSNDNQSLQLRSTDASSPVKYPVAFLGLKMAFTTASGTVMITAIIAGLTTYILKKATSKSSWYTPWGCLIKLIAACIRRIVEVFTKFAVISHSFTGEPFCTAARHTFSLMSKHFGGAFMTDTVAKNTLQLGAFGLSVALGLASWVWVDNNQNFDTITELGSWTFFVILLYAYAISSPVFTTVLVVIVDAYWTSTEDDTQYVANAVMSSLFIGCICLLVFQFLADVILNCTDVVFYCFAIEKEAGRSQDKFRDVYVIIQTEVMSTEAVATNYNQSIPVTCPPDGRPGQVLNVVVDSSTKQTMTVTIPPGVGPGQTFNVTVQETGAQMGQHTIA